MSERRRVEQECASGNPATDAHLRKLMLDAQFVYVNGSLLMPDYLPEVELRAGDIVVMEWPIHDDAVSRLGKLSEPG